MNETTFDRLCRVIVDVIGVDDQDVTAGARFIDDLDCDSLDTIELIIATAEEFRVEIRDSDTEAFVTVADAVAHIENLLAVRQ